MDYDLDRLGPQEFEHMSQALCLSVFGPQVAVFGLGRDGGREAAHEGELRWKALGTGGTWDGLTIWQAKFRYRQQVSTNLKWLQGQLRAELDAWSSRKRRDPQSVPSNFVLITNVRLSAGAQEALDQFHQFAKREVASRELGILNIALWHYDSVCRLLDDHRDVRATYGGYITSGDVLARLDEWLARGTGDLGDALSTHALKDSLAQQWIRLGQAGDAEDKKIALSAVFVDLPAASSPDGPGRVAITRHVLEVGEAIRHDRDATLTSGLLIVGGPGQGKSTLAQMICQAYRVALLQDVETGSAQTQRVLGAIAKRLELANIPIPNHRRWPIRVELASFADFLTDGGGSLLRYIAHLVSKTGTIDISAQDLGSWLGTWPWCVVLDGLDEVASAGSRDAVATAVSTFMVDVATRNADVLLVATTRPQGYAGEFSTEEYDRLDLLPLSPAEALGYGSAFAEARNEHEPDFVAQVQKRLATATAARHTTRLMTTPLQVTIMALLLERRQRVPQDRYHLFQAYFDTIYAREINKATPTAQLLEEYRPDVEYIHEVLGLRLQEMAAASGDQDPGLPQAELRQTATRRLLDEGHDIKAADQLAALLVTAATTRLVLLVPRGDADVGYEVRSLQEFMAARELTAAEDGQVVLDRLKAIAPAAHWRNTWLFAAGRVFSARQTLRPGLLNILAECDNKDLLSAMVCPGSELATDLLADDLAVRAPLYRRQLAERAMARLSWPPDSDWRSLATALFEAAETDEVIRRTLVSRLSESVGSSGGRRAHATLVMGHWQERVGPLATRARQLLTSVGFDRTRDIKLVDTVAVHAAGLWQVLGIDDAECRRLYGRESLLSAAEQKSFSLMLRNLNRGNGTAVRRQRRSAGAVSAPTGWVIPRISDMDGVLGSDRTRVALAQVVDAIEPQHRQVAMTLREYARHWTSRQSTA